MITFILQQSNILYLAKLVANYLLVLYQKCLASGKQPAAYNMCNHYGQRKEQPDRTKYQR